MRQRLDDWEEEISDQSLIEYAQNADNHQHLWDDNEVSDSSLLEIDEGPSTKDDKTERWVIYLQGQWGCTAPWGPKVPRCWGGCRKVYPHPVGEGGLGGGALPKKILVYVGQL